MSGDTRENSWPDLAGRLDGKAHILPIRVYFEDTDFSGMVYHANYLKFCERARSDFIRLLGINHHSLFEGAKAPENRTQEDGAVFVVRRLEIDYLKPAAIDEVLEIKTSVHEMGRVTMKLEQLVIRDDVLLAKILVTIVLINKKGKPLRIGEKLQKLMGQ